MDVNQLLHRAWRRLGYEAVRVRDRRAVGGTGLAAARVAGSWRWLHELPTAPRDELRADHLATVCAALEAAGIDHFVVPDPLGHRPQVGVMADRFPAAMAAVAEATTGWYIAREGHQELLERRSTRDLSTAVLFPRYRARGTQYATGAELGVALVPWHRGDGLYEPDARNAYLSWLRDEDLEERARARAHGRWWPSLAGFAAPHPEARAPMRWFVMVPAELRRQQPRVADMLGRWAARSLWFHTTTGTEVLLLDTVHPPWLRDAESLPVRPPEGDDDALAWLVQAWADGEGPAAVLPAGGLVVGDVLARRLVSPGGLGLFSPDPDPLAVRRPAVGPDPTAEAREVRDWFHRHTDAWMPFAISTLPTGLPAPDPGLVAELTALVEDPARPPVTRPETAVMVVTWWCYLRQRALPGSLRASRHRAGTRRFTQGTAALAASSAGKTESVSVEPDSLVEVDEAIDHLARMAADRFPRPAPWE